MSIVDPNTGLLNKHIDITTETPADYNVIDDAAPTPEQTANIESIKSHAYQAGYLQHQAEAQSAKKEHDRYIASLLRESFEDGLNEGKTVSEQRIIRAQPYEITVDVGTKYSAKGECQPECSIKITRFLEMGDNLTEIVKADVARGTEELMSAVSEIQKRNAGGK